VPDGAAPWNLKRHESVGWNPKRRESDGRIWCQIEVGCTRSQVGTGFRCFCCAHESILLLKSSSATRGCTFFGYRLRKHQEYSGARVKCGPAQLSQARSAFSRGLSVAESAVGHRQPTDARREWTPTVERDGVRGSHRGSPSTKRPQALWAVLQAQRALTRPVAFESDHGAARRVNTDGAYSVWRSLNACLPRVMRGSG
jgi:hypothetical protein